MGTRLDMAQYYKASKDIFSFFSCLCRRCLGDTTPFGMKEMLELASVGMILEDIHVPRYGREERVSKIHSKLD